jgi:hypothetical protein
VAFIVVYDANVLVGNTQRDLLVRIAQTGLVQAKHPDDFVLDQIDINDRVVWACVQQIANSRKRRPETVEDVLSQLERSGLVQSVAALRTT